VGEAKGEVVNDLGFLEGEEGPVVSALGEQLLMGRLGIMGSMGIIFPIFRTLRMIPISAHGRLANTSALPASSAESRVKSPNWLNLATNHTLL